MITKFKKWFETQKEFAKGAHSIHTPFDLINEITSKIDFVNKKILVIFNIEFCIDLVYNRKVSPKQITFYSDHSDKDQMAKMLGVKIIKSLDIDMKFDVVVGNPPYNKGILKDSSIDSKWLTGVNGYPHLAFFNISQSLVTESGVISMLMPASFMTLGSGDEWRRKILKEGNVEELILLDNRKNQIFNIEHTWVCNLIYRKGAPHSTTKYKIGSTELDVDLSNYSYIDAGKEVTTWPMFYDATVKSIYEKVRNKAKPLLRETGNNKKEDFSYIGYILQGVADRPIVNSTPVDKKGKDFIKAPGYILFDSDKDATKYCDFMNTNLYKLMISVTKCISKTQPTSIVQIGNFDFSNVDVLNNDKLYQFFGLNEVEVERVESNS